MTYGPTKIPAVRRVEVPLHESCGHLRFRLIDARNERLLPCPTPGCSKGIEPVRPILHMPVWLETESLRWVPEDSSVSLSAGRVGQVDIVRAQTGRFGPWRWHIDDR